jgi:TonB family protein
VVPLADLMRRPVAPALDTILEREYPRDARLQGESGSALLRVQILPDGSVLVRQHLFESRSGFGDACERVLRQSRWTPALDRDGRPARTEISYRCRFEVRG